MSESLVQPQSYVACQMWGHLTLLGVQNTPASSNLTELIVLVCRAMRRGMNQKTKQKMKEKPGCLSSLSVFLCLHLLGIKAGS